MSILDTVAGELSALAKLVILHETSQRGRFDGVVTALFNPAQLRYDQRAEWRALASVSQAVAGGYQRMEFQATPPQTLAIDLFFDTYEGAPTSTGEGLLGPLREALAPAGSAAAVDVRLFTAQIEQLATVRSELHRPPVCVLQWGRAELFRGVLTQLHQDYSFFLPDGTPVRATLGCSFMAYRTFEQAAQKIELHSADVAKRRVVRKGDTLNSIALAEYGDPARWRDIARENGIDNPRKLPPGTVLVIPKLES